MQRNTPSATAWVSRCCLSPLAEAVARSHRNPIGLPFAAEVMELMGLYSPGPALFTAAILNEYTMSRVEPVDEGVGHLWVCEQRLKD